MKKPQYKRGYRLSVALAKGEVQFDRDNGQRLPQKSSTPPPTAPDDCGVAGDATRSSREIFGSAVGFGISALAMITMVLAKIFG